MSTLRNDNVSMSVGHLDQVLQLDGACDLEITWSYVWLSCLFPHELQQFLQGTR